VREERQKAEVISGRLEELRAELEAETIEVRAQLMEERRNSADQTRRQRVEIEQLQQEVSDKVPKIAAMAVEKLGDQWARKLEQETNSVKAKYEYQLDQQKREILDLQAMQAEREVRHGILDWSRSHVTHT
jgi:hypothetical protein